LMYFTEYRSQRRVLTGKQVEPNVVKMGVFCFLDVDKEE
jgi:hypothetical protein